MILVSCFSNERNAMCDMYKNIINAMPNKKDIVVIIPSAYEKDEFSSEFAYKIKENITSIKRKNKRLIYMARYMYLLKKKLKSYDIKHVYFQNDVFLYNIIIFFLYGKKVSYTLWLHDPILHDGVCKRERIYRNLSIKTYFKTMKKFIISYHAAFNLIDEKNPLNAYKSDMCVLQLPQMPELEFPEIKNTKDTYLYDFIFFGRIEIYKGLELFLDAFKNIFSKKLLIVGTGNDEAKITEMTSGDERITFINQYVTNQELARFIKSAKCVVLPYKSATGSQTVSIANYYNRIVLATKVGCFPEYIEEGKNGFFIEDYTVDAMKSALEKVDYYINICTPDRIKSVYDKFDINRIAAQLYHEIIS